MENVIEFLKQMIVDVPTIIAATLLIMGAIKQICKIEKPWVNYLVAGLVAVGAACAYVAIGRFNFGCGGWDYAIAAVLGLAAGAAATGLYKWDAVQHLIEVIISLFGKGIHAVANLFKKK